MACPLVVLFCMVTTVPRLSREAHSLTLLPVRLSVVLYLVFSFHVLTTEDYAKSNLCECYNIMCSMSFVYSTLCVGLSGGLSRSTGAEIKPEKEDDENCSLSTKSEDDKKDLKARLRTRYLKSH